MSTLLTLVIIPTLYSGLEEALHRLRTQSLTLKIIQLTLLILAVIGIVMITDSLIWQLGYFVGAIILIPAATWFMETSLRQANSRITVSYTHLRGPRDAHESRMPSSA